MPNTNDIDPDQASQAGQPSGQPETGAPNLFSIDDDAPVAAAPVEKAIEAQPDASGEADENAAASPEQPWQPAQLPDHLKPEDAYGFGKYHQSRADQMAAELAKQKLELEEMRTMNRIADALTKDPDLLDTVARSLRETNGRGKTQAAPAPAAEPVVIPPAPAMPADIYDEGAMSKYMAATAARQDAIIAWQQQQDASRAQQLAGYEQVAQQQQQQAQIAQAVQEAKYKYGFSDQQAQQFVDMAVSGRLQNDPDLLAAAFRSTISARPADVARGAAMNDAQQRQQQRTPSTATAMGGGAKPVLAQSLFVEDANPSFDPFD